MVSLYIPCRGKLIPLSDKNFAEVRNKYLEAEIVIIHGISIAFGELLYQICKHLSEMFRPLQEIPFCGKSMLICGDFYQRIQFK